MGASVREHEENAVAELMHERHCSLCIRECMAGLKASVWMRASVCAGEGEGGRGCVDPP